jgi:hypothetical protein
VYRIDGSYYSTVLSQNMTCSGYLPIIFIR